MTETIVRIPVGLAREAWRPLLELADEPVPLRGNLHRGVLHGVREAGTGRPRAAVLVIHLDDGAAELRAVAVAEDQQGRGLGSWIVGAV